MLEALNAFIEANADSTWLLPIVLLLCVLDGVLPPVPSEATLVALGAVAAAEGHPNLLALLAVATVGGIIGDNLTYTIGTHTRLGRLRDSKRGKVRGFVNWVVRLLDRRGGTIIIAGRFVPGGRQLVNVVAGAMEYPRKRFILFDSIAVAAWSAYNVGIGALAGNWLEEQPLLGVLIAVGMALALGWAAEFGAKNWRSRTERKVPAGAT